MLLWSLIIYRNVNKGGRENDMTVEVFYVDYGNMEDNIPMIRLRPIPARFIDCPAHAVPCSLSQVIANLVHKEALRLCVRYK